MSVITVTAAESMPLIGPTDVGLLFKACQQFGSRVVPVPDPATC